MPTLCTSGHSPVCDKLQFTNTYNIALYSNCVGHESLMQEIEWVFLIETKETNNIDYWY